MGAELPRPGVEVIQVFRSTSPTVVTPTLVPCVVGVCRQVVDVLEASSGGGTVLNTDALVPMPAQFIAADAAENLYTGLDGLKLVLSVDNNPAVTVTFTGDSLSPAQVVSQILSAFSDAGVTAATAEVVGESRFMVRTLAAGQFESIEVLCGASQTASAVQSAFGIGPRLYSGRDGYDQHGLVVSPASFPNPRANLDQLSIENDSVRCFLYLGGTTPQLKELLRTQSYLRRGASTSASLTFSADLTGITYASAAVLTGSADATAGALYGGGGTLDTKVLTIAVNGAGPTSLTLNVATNAASQAALLAAIHVQWPTITASINATHLRLTASGVGTASSIQVSSTTGATAFGLATTLTSGPVGTLDTETLSLVINGAAPILTTFSMPGSIADVLSQINANISAVAVATEAPTTNFLVITTLGANITSTIAVPTGTAVSLGFPVAPSAGLPAANTVAPSNGQAVSSIIQFPGQNFTASATAAFLIGSANVPGGGTADDTTLILDDGLTEQTVVFKSATTPAAVVLQINAVMGAAAGGNLLASLSTSKLLLTSLQLGEDSVVKVVGGTACGTLFMTPSTSDYGSPFPPKAGDDIYLDGQLYATITQVGPGGTTDKLKINKSVALSTDLGDNFFMLAKGLTDSTLWNVSRPTPNLQVDLEGQVIIKNDILRDTKGAPLLAGRSTLYVSYSAIRQDVSPIAKNPGLLKYNDTLTLNTDLAPLSPVNPLALGLYFALLNSPGVQVTGVGVDAVSENSPNGTVEAFTRAAEFLEAFEVYAIAPMTHDATVGQIFNTHVGVMSQPGNKGERIALFNPSKPTTKLDTLVASGVQGNSTQTTNTFDTGIQNLGALLLNAGIDPTGPILVSSGLYLAVADSDGKYAIVAVSGSIVTVKVAGFTGGDNDDGYYATTTLSSVLIDEAFAIRIRGAKLVTVSGLPDKDAIADTYAGMAATYLNRRFWHLVPDTCAATINGLEQSIEGFYMCAAVAGMIGQQPPQQSFTNFPMTGFTRVIGSNDYFTEKQLNRMAAGGNYIVVQDAAGAPLIARMALTTDLTSIETRTDSITKVVDYCAKFLRRGLKNFIGRFNITQGFLDSLGHVIQGLLGFLSDTGVLIGSQLNNIVQDESAPDTVLVDITLDVPFPCNYIRLTLVV